MILYTVYTNQQENHRFVQPFVVIGRSWKVKCEHLNNFFFVVWLGTNGSFGPTLPLHIFHNQTQHIYLAAILANFCFSICCVNQCVPNNPIRWRSSLMYFKQQCIYVAVTKSIIQKNSLSIEPHLLLFSQEHKFNSIFRASVDWRGFDDHSLLP